MANEKQVDICLGGQEGRNEDEAFGQLLLDFVNTHENGIELLAEKLKTNPALKDDRLKFINDAVIANKDTQTRVNFLIFANKEKWLKKGIDQVEVHYKDGKKELVVLNPAAKTPRTLRLIFFPPIEHIDFKRLLMASEPFTLCTGDLSFTDAVSANKMFVYEARRHKLGFFDSMIALASRFDPQIAEFLRAYQTHDSAKIASLSKDADFRRKFKQFTSHICTELDMRKRLMLKVRRLFAKKESSEIAQKEKAVFAAVSVESTSDAMRQLKTQLTLAPKTGSWTKPLLATAAVFLVPLLIKALT